MNDSFFPDYALPMLSVQLLGPVGAVGAVGVTRGELGIRWRKDRSSVEFEEFEIFKVLFCYQRNFVFTSFKLSSKT